MRICGLSCVNSHVDCDIFINVGKNPFIKRSVDVARAYIDWVCEHQGRVTAHTDTAYIHIQPHSNIGFIIIQSYSIHIARSYRVE